LTETASSTAGPPRRRRSWPTVLAVVALAILVAALVAYAARRTLARDALTGWLKAQGIESQVAFQAFDPGGFSGALRIGPASDPDFTAEVAEIHYDLLGFWTGDAFGARATSIRLVRPMLKARWRNGRLSFGALDPLIDKLRRRPAQPLGPLPDVAVEQARLRLDTDQGRLTGRADLQIARGRLQRLDLTTDPATLRGPSLMAALGPGELHVAVRGDRVGVAGRASLPALRTGGADLQAASLDLSGQVPYPDLRRPSAAGASHLVLKAAARAGRYGQVRFEGLAQTLDLSGQGAGWGDRLALSGVAASAFEAELVQAGQVRVRGVKLQADSHDFNWTRRDRDRVFGTLHLAAGLKTLDQGAVRLADLSATFDGPAAARIGDAQFDLAGQAATRGGWTGLGAPSRADTPEAAALKRALAAFQVFAPRLTIQAARDGVTLGLPAPLRIATGTGGGGVLQQAHGALYDRGAGGFRLTLDGRGGLPNADLAVDRYRIGPAGAAGAARLDATASLGPVVDGRVQVGGPFRIGAGGLELRADRCADLNLRRLALGANDVEAVSGQLCPRGAPLFALTGSGWRARGEARGFAARVPFLQTAVTDAAGPLDLASRGGDLGLAADIRAARLEDLAAPVRFEPLAARGTATLKAGVWRGDFTLADPAGRRIATARLAHDGRVASGGLAVDTGALVFAPGGLQPASLSPLAKPLGAPVQGTARFSGQAAWTAAGTTSGGRLVVDRLDFRGPAGDVVNLRGETTFSSLAPLRAAPGQTFHADSIGGSLTDATLRFGLDHEAVQVEGGSLALGGGQVRLEPVEIPLAGGGTWKATLDVEGVQLSGLVAASSFADRVSLEAKVSGRVPLEISKAGVRVAGGELHAVGPGRLSIRREALSQVSAAGGTPVDPKAAPAPGTPSPYSDFVYQAMEHLAFSELTAQVDSQAKGRLGVLFHIKGEHQPPQPQQITLTWREILTRRITRQLPLPSGTKVDLTLDTSLNLDQLLADFAAYQDLRGSGAVQAPGPTVPPDNRRRRR
jgi:hypothetical protein